MKTDNPCFSYIFEEKVFFFLKRSSYDPRGFPSFNLRQVSIPSREDQIGSAKEKTSGTRVPQISHKLTSSLLDIDAFRSETSMTP